MVEKQKYSIMTPRSLILSIYILRPMFIIVGPTWIWEKCVIFKIHLSFNSIKSDEYAFEFPIQLQQTGIKSEKWDLDPLFHLC